MTAESLTAIEQGKQKQFSEETTEVNTEAENQFLWKKLKDSLRMSYEQQIYKMKMNICKISLLLLLLLLLLFI